jgi:GNAT superfamily N-acetyltransferase
MDGVFDIALAAHREVGLFPFSVSKFVEAWENCMRREWLCGVIGGVGKLEGACLMAPATVWYSDRVFLNEQFIYVYPRYRASSNSKELLRFAKKQADKSNMNLLIGIMNRVDLDRKIKLYQRQFGQPLGAFFQYKPDELH